MTATRSSAPLSVHCTCHTATRHAAQLPLVHAIAIRLHRFARSTYRRGHVAWGVTRRRQGTAHAQGQSHAGVPGQQVPQAAAGQHSGLEVLSSICVLCHVTSVHLQNVYQEGKITSPQCKTVHVLQHNAYPNLAGSCRSAPAHVAIVYAGTIAIDLRKCTNGETLFGTLVCKPCDRCQ
jgi:hypothetical protein